jgi:hypothetical protein
LTAERHPISAHRVLVGLLVVGLGVLLFLEEIHVANAHAALDWYLPAALFLIGVSLATRMPGSRGRFWGWVLIALGGLLAARRLGAPLPEDVFDLFWPLVLIALGARLLTRSRRPRWRRPEIPAEAVPEDGARVWQTAVLSSHEIRSTAACFSGGRLAAVCGACTLDLTAARSAPGGARIEVAAVCGGIAIRVPEGWEVKSEVTPVLGGFEDKTRRVPGTPPTGLLVVRGAAVFGGVEITN